MLCAFFFFYAISLARSFRPSFNLQSNIKALTTANKLHNTTSDGSEERLEKIRDAVKVARTETSENNLTYQDVVGSTVRYNLNLKEKAAAAPKQRRQSISLDVAESGPSFQERKFRLVLDNVYISFVASSIMWTFIGFKETVSYSFGAFLGSLYLILLGRYVETLGTSGAGGGGPARLTLAVLLVLCCGKNRDTFDLLPALAGFFTYQLSTLVQGLYDSDTTEK